jgi:tryptophanyl-tRNA synthetase
LSELTVLYLNLVTISRLERNPTVKEEIRQRRFQRDIPAGFLCYPISQSADITAFRATKVPVGDDQLPMIELAQEIALRVNRLGGSEVLPRPEAVLSAVTRLPGIDGLGKASKSLGNAIQIGDPGDVVREKVRMMFTDPAHLRVSDPGRVEGNVVFSYLDAFDPDAAAVAELKARYRAGGLGDSALKRRLVDVLEGLLSPMRERRRGIDRAEAMAILAAGTVRARTVAAQTLASVRSVLGMPVLL